MKAAVRPSQLHNHGESYHGDDDGIVIPAQTSTDHQPGSGTHHDKAEADDVERNRDDDKDHSTAMQTNISSADDPRRVNDTHDGDGKMLAMSLRD